MALLSVKQWYQLLLERGTTHTSEDNESAPVLIHSKLEEAHPGKDLSNCYRMARLFGLTPDQKSFLFKMIQNILPTRERLHRVGKVPSPACNFCSAEVDNLEHLLVCSQGSEVTTPLLSCLTSQDSNLAMFGKKGQLGK